MKIGLYGIYGLYNYGCEAIVRGTCCILKRINPNVQIIYFSMQANEDKEILKDLDIDVIQLTDNRALPIRAINVACMRSNIPHRFGKTSYRQIVNECDVVFSIGGDLYTIPLYLRKQNKYPYYNDIVQFGNYAHKRNRKMVVFGASIGPFGGYKKARDYYLTNLKEMNLIVAREEKSIDYLKESGIEGKVIFMPDPAFAVSIKEELQNTRPEYIGVNLSPLSVKEVYGGLNDSIIKELSDLVLKIHKATRLDVMLLPHVISPYDEIDNDFEFLKKIWGSLPKDIQKHVYLERERGFLNVKRALRTKCRIVVSARMHCAINAVKESIPTIFLSYSDKSKGMARFVYNNDKWVISIENMKANLIDKIQEMLNQEASIREVLKIRNEVIADMLFDSKEIEKIKGVLV